MSCTASWAFKAKNRSLKIQIRPAAGSTPTLIEFAVGALDRNQPDQDRSISTFSASQLTNEIQIPLRDAMRYEMMLITSPQGTELICDLSLSDSTPLVTNQSCVRDQWPVVAHWNLTTWQI